MFQLLCKASSQNEGWMKSTKAMEIPGIGCVVQVSTQQKNPDGSYTVAEAVTFVPGVEIGKMLDANEAVVGRSLISARTNGACCGGSVDYSEYQRRADIYEQVKLGIIGIDEARKMLGII